MLAVWIVGIIFNLILVFIWSRCYINKYSEYVGCRIPVNILVAILFIVSALIPIFNFLSVMVFALMFGFKTGDYYIEWRFPKWMTKTIK